MKINKDKIEVTFTFSPKDYFLVHNIQDTTYHTDIWSLNYRIDMSYADKPDQIGMPRLFLSDEEAEQLKKEGFSWTEI